MSTSSLAGWAGSPPPPSQRPPHQPATYEPAGAPQAGPSTANSYQHSFRVHQQRPRTPPGSVGIRRVRSFGNSMTPSSTQHIYPPGNLPSPTSPTLRNLTLQPAEGASDPSMLAPPNDGWIYTSDPVQPPLRQAPPPPSFAVIPPPHTPTSRHKRNASAEVYATPASQRRAQHRQQPGLSAVIPEYEAPSMSYSHTMPADTRDVQQPTAEEVSQFFRDMTELLGEDAMNALSPTSPSNAYPSLSLSATPDCAPSSSSTSAAPFPLSPTKKTYNVSGILLDEDEYRQYANSPSPNRQPSPAQYFAPGETYQPPPPAPSAVYTTHLAPPPQQPYYGSSYGYELQRPQSAPPTPALEAPPPFMHQPPPPPPTMQDQPQRPYASLRHRRGSSLDLSAIPRSIPSGLSAPSSYYPVPSNPHLPRPPPSYAQQYPPPPSHFNYNQPPPPSAAYQTPSRPSFVGYDPFTYPPPASSRPYQQPPSPPPTAHAYPSTPTKPPKRGHGRNRSNGVAFINFSAADSKTLLNGVAPSGNMKKRQREEEDAAKEKEREKGRETKRVAVEK